MALRLIDEGSYYFLSRPRRFGNIDNSAVALKVREGLKDFYSVIKDSDAYSRFAFLTGVSKFRLPDAHGIHLAW